MICRFEILILYITITRLKEFANIWQLTFASKRINSDDLNLFMHELGCKRMVK